MGRNRVDLGMPRFRSLLVTLAASVLALGLGGCASDPADAVIGTWVLDVEHSTLPPVPPALQAMAGGAANAYSLQLDPDGKFSIKLWRSLEGTWQLESDTVFLTPKDGRASVLGELEFKVLRNEQRLQAITNSPLGQAKLLFKRAPAATP